MGVNERAPAIRSDAYCYAVHSVIMTAAAQPKKWQSSISDGDGRRSSAAKVLLHCAQLHATMLPSL